MTVRSTRSGERRMGCKIYHIYKRGHPHQRFPSESGGGERRQTNVLSPGVAGGIRAHRHSCNTHSCACGACMCRISLDACSCHDPSISTAGPHGGCSSCPTYPQSTTNSTSHTPGAGSGHRPGMTCSHPPAMLPPSSRRLSHQR